MGAIDLGRIDPARWRVLVEDTSYGPYTLGQLRAFAESGRLTATSRVAADGATSFRPASQIPQLETIFPCPTAVPRSQISEGNFLIVTRAIAPTDVSDDGSDRIWEALNGLGRFIELSAGIYILRTAERLASIHRAMRAATGDLTEIIIVDASEDRLAWLNLDADDEAVRDLWKPTSVRSPRS